MLKLKQTLSSIFILFYFFSYSTIWAQNSGNINIPAGQTTLKSLIQQIEKQSDYSFVFDNSISLNENLLLKERAKDIKIILKQAFQDREIEYEIIGKQIILKKKEGNITSAGLIKGIIKDENGEIVIGASVRIKNSSTGTITDINGGFSLSAPGNAELQISYIGYTTQTIKIDGRKNIEIVMKEASRVLDEVVVVGYGTQNKNDLTGSITVVSSEKLLDIPATNIADALVGKIPGALIQNAGGSNPSGGTVIRIRGTSSLSGSANSPLIVVDGVTLFDENINSIDPQNIESINVLKDASSTAIYGARAAAGVIIVTTKKGKEGKGKIHLSVDQGFQNIYKNYDVTDAATTYNVLESGWNTWEKLGQNRDKTKIKQYNDLYSSVLWNKEQGKPMNNVDWKNSLVRNVAYWQKYGVGFSGGIKDIDFYLNISFEQKDGIMMKTDFSRLSLASNVNYRVKSNIKIGLVSNISYTTNEGIGGFNDRFGIYMPTVYKAPYIPMYDSEGEMIVAAEQYKIDKQYALSPLQNTFAAKNQLYDVLTAKHAGTTQRVINNFYFDWSPLKNLSFRTNLGFDLSARNNKDIQYLQEKKYLEIGNNSQRDLVSTSSHFIQKRNWLANETVTYNLQLDKHKVNVTGVFELQENYGEFLRITANGSTDNDLDQISNQPQNDVLSENGLVVNPRNFAGAPEGRIRLASLMGRVNYSFFERYLFTFTVRSDGSSKFARGNQWGTFSSVAGSWKLSNENFWNLLPQQFTSAKIRLSYGITGNQSPIGSFQYLSNIGFGNGNFGNFYVSNNLANPFLQWETLKQFNAGIDLSFFNNRIQLSFDYYDKVSKNMLGNIPLTVSSGFSTAVGNIGSIGNKGVEFSLNSVNINTRNFKWTTDFSLSHNRDKIIDLGTEADGAKIDNVISDRYIRYIGGPISEFFLYEIEGVWQQNSEIKPWGPNGFNDFGLFRIKDQNGDKKIDTNDRVKKGSPEPKISGGLTNTFTYKNLSMNIVCTYMAGNKLYNIPKAYLEYSHPLFAVNSDFAEKHWTPENPTNDYERASTQVNNLGHLSSDGISLSSDKWLEDASFFKVANIGFTYKLPHKWFKSMNISSAQIGMSVSNIVTFTKYSGLSPETDGGLVTGGDPSFRGVDNGGYPEARTFQASIKFNF